MARKDFRMALGVLVDGKWTGEWHSPCEAYVSPTLASLRNPAKYWIVSDAQLKRDLAGRTLADVYRDNHAGRVGIANWGTQYSPRFGKYQPRNDINGDLRSEYLADCAARNHVPHPASIDSDHAQNCHREKAPKVERVSPAMEWSGMAGRMVPRLAPGQYFDNVQVL